MVLKEDIPTIPAGPEIRTHNLPVTSPTRYPLGHDCHLANNRLPIIHPAGDKGMNKFLQVLTGDKTSNSCNVFEMIVC